MYFVLLKDAFHLNSHLLKCHSFIALLRRALLQITDLRTYNSLNNIGNVTLLPSKPKQAALKREIHYEKRMNEV